MLESFRQHQRAEGETGARAAGSRDQEAGGRADEPREGRGGALGFGPDHGERRAREEFGGINWGAAFFGWLVAVGLGAILIALAGAVLAGIGLSNSPSANRSAAGTATLVAAIVVLAVMMVAYYSGGYVAGRMSRFDGGRQGTGVWVIGLVIAILLAILGAIAGAQFNVLSQLRLPSVPLSGATLTTGGLITLVAILLGTLLAATIGGKAGQRYHSKVDRLATS